MSKQQQQMTANLKARTAAKTEAIPQGQRYEVGQLLPLDQIRMDGGTQARAGLDNQTLAEYAESWYVLSSRQNGFLEMPLIIVYHDGKDYWLADGFHRVVAYRQFLDSGKASASPHAIRAEVRMGTKRDAVLYACGANATHGLKRTQADKRRAIETLLSDDEWKQWSDSEIGRRCQVDHKTVASVRAEIYPGNSQDSRTVERGGTTFQQKAKQSTPTPAPAPHPKPPTCIRCGAERTQTRSLTSYQAGLIDAYPDRDVTLCSRCIPELLAAQRAADVAPFWQSMSPNHPTAHLWTRVGMNEHHAACGMVTQRVPSGSTTAGHCSSCEHATWKEELLTPAAAPAPPEQPTIESLDATLEQSSLHASGYFWQSASPPILANNDGWRGDAPTVGAALALAADREKQRALLKLAISQAQHMIELLYAGNWNDATSAYTTLGRTMGIGE